jgi:hypothetical protein
MARPPAVPAPGRLPPVDGLMTPGGGPGDAPDTGDASATDTGDAGDVIVSICRESDGSYTVYPGPPPEGSEDEGLSEDDAAALGGGPASGAGPGGGMPMGGPGGGLAGGAGPAPGGNGAAGGIAADSIGAALKAALDILQADKGDEEGAGNADDAFAAGYNSSTEPTPVGMGQKYPRA